MAAYTFVLLNITPALFRPYKLIAKQGKGDKRTNYAHRTSISKCRRQNECMMMLKQYNLEGENATYDADECHNCG